MVVGKPLGTANTLTSASNLHENRDEPPPISESKKEVSIKL